MLSLFSHSILGFVISAGGLGVSRNLVDYLPMLLFVLMVVATYFVVGWLRNTG